MFPDQFFFRVFQYLRADWIDEEQVPVHICAINKLVGMVNQILVALFAFAQRRFSLTSQQEVTANDEITCGEQRQQQETQNGERDNRVARACIGLAASL